MVHPELRPFLEKAQSSLQAAEVLFEHHLYPSSASRAYYAVFVGASLLLTEMSSRKPISIKTMRIEWEHETVHSAFLNEFHARRRLFTKEDVDAYTKLREARENADYGIVELTPQRAKRLLTSSRQLLAKIEGLVEDAHQIG